VVAAHWRGRTASQEGGGQEGTLLLRARGTRGQDGLVSDVACGAEWRRRGQPMTNGELLSKAKSSG
jgi:hypothetical protein